jgi:hypothetical protein
MPTHLAYLLGLVVVLGAVSAVAFSTSYQLVAWFRYEPREVGQGWRWKPRGCEGRVQKANARSYWRQGVYMVARLMLSRYLHNKRQQYMWLICTTHGLQQASPPHAYLPVHACPAGLLTPSRWASGVWRRGLWHLSFRWVAALSCTACAER